MNIMKINLLKNLKFHQFSSRLYGSQNGTPSLIKVYEENLVKTVVLSSPKTRNALSLTMLEELKDNILKYNSNLRCIILKAEGSVFSSGHNLKELTGETGQVYHNKVFESCAELMIGFTKLPFPVLAQVNGVAAAAGCQLVASCDIVIASDKSSFMTPGANFGIFCSTPGIPLVRNVPMKVAADMLLTGLPISASEAFNAGLISAVVPESELEKETKKRIEAICNKSRSVIAVGKELGGQVMVKNINMKDGQEGIRSFIEKKKPVWSHENE
ncbi:Enoyl-CoA hydratase domain-containing protein 3, mitochondrial [Armadillidium nasatum]|uniref:Enoyl-CoA hydratase domain-containing protein 3, mitochondrial n=1 Tax=Armadillidium nasatum TaxID=96803 RepID=A0A5N5SVI1_9CRUS|nr:Enoyl-CoA hydratase domain-containing protein 3, mitochondrial [Armadillidium nasatum]